MKNAIILTLFLALGTSTLFAQTAPQAIKYQAVARDGNAIVIGSVGIQFSIIENAPDGEILFKERHFPDTNDAGIFSVNIGEGVTTDGNFTMIDWSSGIYFLQVEIDPNGGANYTDLGTSQILSVPYALYADRASRADTASVSLNDFDTDPQNELQILNFNNGFLELFPGGGNVAIDDNDWTVSGSTRYTFGNVGIGTTTPSERLTVHSSIGTKASNGDDLVLLGATNSGGGYFETVGTNGNENFILSSLLNEPNNGYAAVRDDNGVNQAGMYVDENGDGIIFGDEKNFRMNHPLYDDKEIWYACIEGPESAAYERGSSELSNGETFVELSEHFQLVGNPETMTVILTPLSGASKGLAVIEKSKTGFKVKELMQGTGNYSFD